MTRKRQEKFTQDKRGQSLSKERLDELVDEATVDAHDESEQATGFYTMLENDLRLPFETEVLGITVMVESIDIAEDDRLVAICGSGKHRQRIGSHSPTCHCPQHCRTGPSGSWHIVTGELAPGERTGGTGGAAMPTDSGSSPTPPSRELRRPRTACPGCRTDSARACGRRFA